MNIKQVFILAAGFGTRMGELGKSLPKVLWPIFERDMLDLEIEYWKERGGDEFYLNLHFHADIISSAHYLQSPKVHLLHEEELLGVGGAIFNLKRSFPNLNQIVLTTSDQFFHLESETLLKDANHLNQYPVFLYSIPTQKWQKHNGIELNQENELVNILSPEQIETEVYPTYSGLSLLDISHLENREGNQSFFGTIADYKNKKILVKPIEEKYWDFGTFDRYVNNLQNLWQMIRDQKYDSFAKFLIRQKAIKEDSLTPVGYNSDLFSIFTQQKSFIIGIGMNLQDLRSQIKKMNIDESTSRGVLYSGVFHEQSESSL